MIKCRKPFAGIILIAISFLLVACQPKKSEPTLLLNFPYHEARKTILQSGWKPAEDMPPYEEIGALAHQFRDLGYAEVEDCTGSGLLACLFYFQNEEGEYLKIGTSGEYPDPHFNVQTKVVYAATLKDMRHVRASMEIKGGANPKEIKSLMGHSSIKVTYDVYGHLFQDHEDRRAARANQIAASLITGC